MKICTGSYIKRGTLEMVPSHAPIVYDEQAVPLSECPLCSEKVWHEDTAQTLRKTEEEVGTLKSILTDCRLSHLIP